jgi:putative hemin transport protein
MNTTATLKDQWRDLIQTEPGLRIRNAAAKLGVTEAELLATRVGEDVTLLKPEFQEILNEIESLGKVMALTRNNEVVHERKGEYLNPTLDNPHVGLFVGDDIDLRIFFASWKFAFAVTDDNGRMKRQSIQFFANDGEAVHKIYLTDKSDENAYQKLIEKYRANEQESSIVVEPKKEKEAETPDNEIDLASFRKGWTELNDTHHFFGLLKEHKLARKQALRLAPEGNYAVKMDKDAIKSILQKAVENNVSIMVFVGNKGMIQIHTGVIKKLLERGPWYNVMDPDFNLHINMDGIVDAWVVRKPTEDGMVTAIECFNKDENQVVQFIGKRKPGIPELESWREIVREVESEHKLS